MLKKIYRNKFDIINYGLLTVMLFIFIYPVYYVLIASVSEPTEVFGGTVTFWPKGFTLEGYKYIFETKKIWVGYRNSIIYTFFGVILSLVITYPAAYAMSKQRLVGKGFIAILFVITMYFSGGLLPTYIMVKSIGLVNKPITLIIMGCFSVHNMIVARTYFENSIDNTLYEAAEVDGCSQFSQFFRIALPLAKPSIAVITLYYAVSEWNGFMTGLIYINKSAYFPLQLVLRSILVQNTSALAGVSKEYMTAEMLKDAAEKAKVAAAMKYGVIIIASLPMLILYPFIQKHFVKGIMIGSLKG